MMLDVKYVNVRVRSILITFSDKLGYFSLIQATLLL